MGVAGPINVARVGHRRAARRLANEPPPATTSAERDRSEQDGVVLVGPLTTTPAGVPLTSLMCC